MPARALSRNFARPAIVFLLLLLAAGCSRPLPEPEGVDTALYQAKCGVCHQAFGPALLTAAMWEAQVDMMAGDQMKRARIPLSNQERARILAYLARNAAGR